MQQNLKIDGDMREKMENNALSLPERLLLAAGMRVADCLPEATVYLQAQRQGARAPAVFLQVQQDGQRQGLGPRQKSRFVLQAEFWPEDALQSGRVDDALEQLGWALGEFSSGGETFRSRECRWAKQEQGYLFSGVIEVWTAAQAPDGWMQTMKYEVMLNGEFDGRDH